MAPASPRPTSRRTLAAGALPVPVATVLDEAADLVRHGRQADARLRLLALWHQFGSSAQPLSRCAVAHDLAELQVRPQQQLDWHLRALEVADAIDRSKPLGEDQVVPLDAIYPQLQLAVAEAYCRLGEACGTLEHLQLARAAAEGLPRAVRAEVQKAAKRIDSQLDRRPRFLPDDEDDEPWDVEDLWDDELPQDEEGPAPRWLVDMALATARRVRAERAAAEQERTADPTFTSAVRRPQ
jgi:hypothetical protein